MKGGGESVRVAFRNPPFHPDPTMQLLLRILGLPQTVKSRLSSVTGPSKDLPPTWPLTFPVLSVPVLWPGQHGGVGKRARGAKVWGGVRRAGF